MGCRRIALAAATPVAQIEQDQFELENIPSPPSYWIFTYYH
jgi:hypothetical protein